MGERQERVLRKEDVRLSTSKSQSKGERARPCAMFESTHVRENDSPKRKLAIECHMRPHTPTSCKGTMEVSTEHESQAFLMNAQEARETGRWESGDVGSPSRWKSIALDFQTEGGRPTVE